MGVQLPQADGCLCYNQCAERWIIQTLTSSMQTFAHSLTAALPQSHKSIHYYRWNNSRARGRPLQSLVLTNPRPEDLGVNYLELIMLHPQPMRKRLWTKCFKPLVPLRSSPFIIPLVQTQQHHLAFQTHYITVSNIFLCGNPSVWLFQRSRWLHFPNAFYWLCFYKVISLVWKPRNRLCDTLSGIHSYSLSTV